MEQTFLIVSETGIRTNSIFCKQRNWEERKSNCIKVTSNLYKEKWQYDSIATINSWYIPYINNLTWLYHHVNPEKGIKSILNVGNLYYLNTVWYPEDFTIFIRSTAPTSKMDNGTFKHKFYMLHKIWGFYGGEDYMVS